jgi:hypothetical protein
MTRLRTTLIVLLAASIIGVAAVLVFRQAIEETIGEKLLGITYQFLLLVVAGGAVSLFYREFTDLRSQQRERQDKQQDELREKAAAIRETYGDLVQAYNTSKKSRRILHAKALRIEEEEGQPLQVVLLNEYASQLDLIMDIQLQFEFYRRHIPNNSHLFSDVATLTNRLSDMEDYLRGILREYEEALPSIHAESQFVRLEKLPRLQEFIEPDEKEQGPFFTKYVRPFEKLLLELSRMARALHEASGRKSASGA